MDPVPLLWLVPAVVAWWVGATAAGVRHELVRLEAGRGQEEDYALLARLRRLQDDPVALSLRLRFSRFFAAAFVPAALAAGVAGWGWAWIAAAAGVGWLATASSDAAGGGRFLRWLGGRSGGGLYGAWARFTEPAARAAALLRRSSEPHPRDRGPGPQGTLPVSTTPEEAELGREERVLLHRFLARVDEQVAHITTPWERVAWVDGEARIQEAAAVAHESGHSRLPVVVEGRTVGVVTVKDLLPRLHDPEARDVPVRELAGPAYFVAGALTVRQLLEELQQARRHLAIVVDRLGRQVGVVTMEDLLEEIVGELHDERERQGRGEAR